MFPSIGLVLNLKSGFLQEMEGKGTFSENAQTAVAQGGRYGAGLSAAGGGGLVEYAVG